MNAAIKLSDLVQTMESQDDESELFVNSRTGEILIVSEEEIIIAEGGAITFSGTGRLPGHGY